MYMLNTVTLISCWLPVMTISLTYSEMSAFGHEALFAYVQYLKRKILKSEFLLSMKYVPHPR